MEITKQMVRRVLRVVDRGLSKGAGSQTPGDMDIEAAVCYALGEALGGSPSCVSPALSRFNGGLNDADSWRSKMARAKGLRRLAVAQLGAAGILDERLFVQKLSKVVLTKLLPKALRSVAATQKEPHKSKLLEVAHRCETEGTVASALAAQKVGNDATFAAAQAAARAFDPDNPKDSAALFAAEDEARSVTEAAKQAAFLATEASKDMAAFRASVCAEQKEWAVDRAAWAAEYAAGAQECWGDDDASTKWGTQAAAEWAADVASGKADRDANAVADAAVVYPPVAAVDAAAFAGQSAAQAFRGANRLLTDFAEEAVQILVAMKTPGSRFLYLTQ